MVGAEQLLLLTSPWFLQFISLGLVKYGFKEKRRNMKLKVVSTYEVIRFPNFSTTKLFYLCHYHSRV